MCILFAYGELSVLIVTIFVLTQIPSPRLDRYRALEAEVSFVTIVWIGAVMPYIPPTQCIIFSRKDLKQAERHTSWL